MKSLLLVVLALAPAFAQTPAPKSVLGLVTAFRAEATEILVKPDAIGAPVAIKFGPDTAVQRIAPGERDLKKAETIAITDVAIGDRVLVSFAAGETEARRIIVMSATDITKRNQADQQDWIKRGISGIVASKKGNDITLRIRSMRGESTAVVTVGSDTRYRRYAPDSVRFADAKNSALPEVAVGDQLRGRGVKSEDGAKVTAEEVVFGTFLTRAGVITALDPEAKEITVKETGTNKSFAIKITADSQLKKMPSMPGMGPGAGPGGPGRGPGGPGGGPARGPGGPGGPPDLAQMIERMPISKLEDLKPGETIIVSSTKGAKNDQLTAIMLLGNAEMIVRMATMQQAASPQAGRGGGLGMGGGGMGMGLGGLEMPTMVP